MAALHMSTDQRWTALPSFMDTLTLCEIDRAEAAPLRDALAGRARTTGAQADADTVFEALTAPDAESVLVSVMADGLAGGLARADWEPGQPAYEARLTWTFAPCCTADRLADLMPGGALLAFHAADDRVLLVGMGALHATSELRALLRLGGTQR